jgi:hypothetical protein
VRRMIAAVKSAGNNFSTNLFLADAALEPLAAAGRVVSAQAEGAAVFLLREPRFDRLCYAAADPSLLMAPLAEASAGAGRAIVADLVGKREALAPIVDRFVEAGYGRRTTLLRLQRTSSPVVSGDTDVGIASEAEAPQILAAMETHFDEYSDRIPPLEQIRAAAAAGTILAARDGKRLAGFYYYDRTGLTTEARFWLVLPEYRDNPLIGSRLLRRYLQITADCRRAVLWVHESNRQILRMYARHGYTPDGIVDIVLVRPSASA